MSRPIDPHALAVFVDLLPALVWCIIAYHGWRLGRELHGAGRRFGLAPRGRLLRIVPILAAVTALHYVLHALVGLTPAGAADLRAVLEALIAVSIATSLALFRNLVPALAVPEEATSRAWIAANYGSAAAVSLIALVPLAFPAWRERAAPLTSHVVPTAYAFGAAAFGLRHARRLVRRGAWRPGPSVSELRSPDIVVIGAALLGTGGMLIVLVAIGAAAPGSSAELFLHTAIGLGLAVPFVVRMFGRFVRTFLASVFMLAAAAGILSGARTLRAAVPGPDAGRLVDATAVVLLVLVLGPGRSLVATAIERVVFRRGGRRLAELRAFLQALSPEVGTAECCRLALGELCRAFRLRGAAVLLDDGTSAAGGTFTVAPLVRVWPRGAAADVLPARAFTEGDLLSELPPTLRDALREAEVVWFAPIVSPRRRWGHLFATEGLFSTPSTSEDGPELGAFVSQLALLLDAAELLGRARAVERSLAHAERLAAIGETTARIAHDIRNPVTAARSLAQQLARAPGSPFTAEHAVILDELDRVERHVAGLLRFARREDLRLEAVDVTELVRSLVGQYRPRLDAAGIAVRIDAPGQLTVAADREKLRQVLMNLIDNAADALADAVGPRTLAITLAAANGKATIGVADSGPGVSEEALPRLFEPFFSLKSHGTGLGLAIAKRTIDAHGGRIAAETSPAGGMTFRIDLPLGGVP